MAKRKRNPLIRRAALLTVLLATVSVLEAATRPTVGAFYVMNLGRQPVAAYKLRGSPFEVDGVEVQRGQLLADAEAAHEGQVLFDFYWQLHDRRIYAERVDLTNVLPAGFEGDVMFSIHDDHVEVSWANFNQAWLRASRDRDIAKIRLLTPFDSCDGPLFRNQVTHANRNSPPIGTEIAASTEKMDHSKCSIDARVTRRAPWRTSSRDEEIAQQRAREEWRAIYTDLIERDVAGSAGGPIRVR